MQFAARRSVVDCLSEQLLYDWLAFIGDYLGLKSLHTACLSVNRRQSVLCEPCFRYQEQAISWQIAMLGDHLLYPSQWRPSGMFDHLNGEDHGLTIELSLHYDIDLALNAENCVAEELRFRDRHSGLRNMLPDEVHDGLEGC